MNPAECIAERPEDNCNYSPGVTQAMIDAHYRSWSDIATEESDRQHRLQAALQVLVSILDAEEDTEVLAIGIDYEAVRAAIEDATVSPDKLDDMIADADAQRIRDEENWA
jgi:hypothetical protein